MSTTNRFDISDDEFRSAWLYIDIQLSIKGFSHKDFEMAEFQFRELCVTPLKLTTWCNTWFGESELKRLKEYLGNADKNLVTGMHVDGKAINMLRAVAKNENLSIAEVVDKYLSVAYGSIKNDQETAIAS